MVTSDGRTDLRASSTWGDDLLTGRTTTCIVTMDTTKSATRDVRPEAA